MTMLKLLADGLVLSGVCVLTGVLIPVRRLIAQLPPGQMRRRWYTLAVLIALFIVSYTSYAVAYWNRHATWPDLIVPGVFFLGAGFVWLTANLSLQTATDIRRVTILEHESITDPLIGIYNRRYLDRRLEEEFARARRYGLPLSVLMLDIDLFKRVNDTYGHQVGDLVLTYLGELLLQAVRESDIVARYGGEEILVIAPNAAASSAVALAERLRQHVETHELSLKTRPDGPRAIRITVSVGVAVLNREIADSQGLVRNADKALYRAKQDGRNRVVMHEV